MNDPIIVSTTSSENNHDQHVQEIPLEIENNGNGDNGSGNNGISKGEILENQAQKTKADFWDNVFMRI